MFRELVRMRQRRLSRWSSTWQEAREISYPKARERSNLSLKTLRHIDSSLIRNILRP